MIYLYTVQLTGLSNIKFITKHGQEILCLKINWTN